MHVTRFPTFVEHDCTCRSKFQIRTVPSSHIRLDKLRLTEPFYQATLSDALISNTYHFYSVTILLHSLLFKKTGKNFKFQRAAAQENHHIITKLFPLVLFRNETIIP